MIKGVTRKLARQTQIQLSTVNGVAIFGDGGTVWVSKVYEGVYSIESNARIILFTDEDGLKELVKDPK